MVVHPVYPNPTKTRKGSSWWTRYREYLKSPQWKTFRLGIFLARGRACEECLSKSKLHLHHKTYVRMGHELPQDVQILCVVCHQKKHPNKRLFGGLTVGLRRGKPGVLRRRRNPFKVLIPKPQRTPGHSGKVASEYPE